MKCPDCNANFSELRDVCPGCSNDLRDYKTKFNIPVSFPELPYDELILRFPKTRSMPQLKAQSQAVSAVTEEPPEDEFIALFNAAYGDISMLPVKEFSLGTAQLGRTVDHKEISLLFQVLDSALFESAKYVEEIQTSESKFVESAELQSQLDRFEEIASSPLFSMKGTRPGVAPVMAIQSVHGEKRAGYKPSFLNRSSRITSALIDGCVVLFLSGMFSFLVLRGYQREFFFENIEDLFITFGDILSLSAGLYIPCAIFYLLSTSFLARRTVGLYLVGGVFASREGKRAPTDALLIRSILSPVTAILSGFVPLLTGTKGWHERIAEMDIVSISRKRTLPSS